MLILAEEKFPDQLRADFQQYYGLNLDGMGIDYSYSHAASILRQLPSNSRIARAENPDAEWTDDTWFLAQIEYGVRLLMWAQTKDAEKGRNRPEPPQTPREAALEKERGANVDRDFVERILGKG